MVVSDKIVVVDIMRNRAEYLYIISTKVASRQITIATNTKWYTSNKMG
jgi:hypothetical protein